MDFIFDVFSKSRSLLTKVLEDNSLETLNKIPSGFNNNIIWNVAHIMVSQEVLVYKLSGLPMIVNNELIDKYRKGTKPEVFVTKTEIDHIKGLLLSTLEKLKKDYSNRIFKDFHEYTVVTTGNTLRNVEDAIQFALFHEGLHMGYIMALLKAVKV